MLEKGGENMNLKRLIATGAGAAMILGATAVPALAIVPNGDGGGFTLIKNKAWVKNITVTKADTGDNAIVAGRDVNGGSIGTGVAVAGASVGNVVNWNEVDPCGCDGVTIIKNKANLLKMDFFSLTNRSRGKVEYFIPAESKKNTRGKTLPFLRKYIPIIPNDKAIKSL